MIQALLLGHSAGHYGDPFLSTGCLKDEANVTTMTAKGPLTGVCAQNCSTAEPCPTDYPSAMSSVSPQCLQINGGGPNCLLTCTSSSNCGKAACRDANSGKFKFCSYADPFLPLCPKGDDPRTCQTLVQFHTVFSEGDGWEAGSKKGWPGSAEQGISYCQVFILT